MNDEIKEILSYLKKKENTRRIKCVTIEESKQLLNYVTQLTNNWNELEEWLKNHYEVKNKTQNEYIDEVLDKMKEIKDGNSEKL